MSACIVLFYISSLLAGGAGQMPAPAREGGPPGGVDADRLYADRSNLASARAAAAAWSAQTAANPRSFEGAWKLARADYWLGGHAPDTERRALLESGIAAARQAIAIEPDQPHGHFWLAANMGALAESFGIRQGLKYRKPIKTELETVLRLDAGFQQRSADRALGRWYFKVPALFGGSRQAAEAHLRASLQANPDSTASRFFLAELLLDAGRRNEARAELLKVLAAPVDPEWTPEDLEFKARARGLLNRIPQP